MDRKGAKASFFIFVTAAEGCERYRLSDWAGIW